MPGGLFFPPRDVRVSAPQDNTVEYYRALAAILPFAVMAVLIVICLTCAECVARRKRKAKEAKAAARRALRDPNKPFSAKEELARERVLRTPTGSPETPPSWDFMNMCDRPYDEKIGDFRNVLWKENAEQQSETPAFARLRPSPPQLFKKEEDQPVNLKDQPDEPRPPSPQTQQGKQTRQGAWVRTDSLTSSASSDTSQSPLLFQMSISDEEVKRAKEEEEKEKARKRVLKEKKRLKKEMREEQAEAIRQQIASTVQEGVDKMTRESKAIDIPRRKRIEEHPMYQRMLMEMVDENNAEFDETTVLNTAWEKGRLEEFIQKNLGYAPEQQMGAIGGWPVVDFPTHLYVTEEVEDPLVDVSVTKLSLPRKSILKATAKGAEGKDRASQRRGHRRRRHRRPGATGSKGQSAGRKVEPETGTKPEIGEYMGQYYVKIPYPLVPVPGAEGEDSQHGAGKKVPLETGAEGGASQDLSRSDVKAVSATEVKGEASQHGARRKVPLETEAKDKASKDLSQSDVKVASATEGSQHGARRKVPLETGGNGKASLDMSQSDVKKAVSATEKGEASQHGARRKVSLETGAKGKASRDLSQYYVRKVVPVTEAEGEASQHHAVRWRSPLETVFPIPSRHDAKMKKLQETEAKTDTTQPPGAKGEDSQHQDVGSKIPELETAAKGKADDSQPLLLQHRTGMKMLPKTEAKGSAFQPAVHLPVQRVLPVTKGESSQLLLHHRGAERKVHESQAAEEKKLKGSVDTSQPLFHHYGAGKNYGTMAPEVRPMGAFTKKMMDTRVPLVIGKEYEEKSLSETRKVSTKIAKAVFDIEMKRIEDQMIASQLKMTEKDKQQVEIHQEPSSSGLIRKQSSAVEEGKHAVEIHQAPSSSGLIRTKPIPVVEIHQKPSSSELIRKPSSAVKGDEHVVEIHQEPSSSGLIRKPSSAVEEGKHAVEIHKAPSSSGLTRTKAIPVIEIHQKPASSELIRKPSSAVKGDKQVVEINQEPSTSELRKKPLPVVEGKHVEIHQEPSSSGLTRKKPSPVFEQDENVVEIHQEPSSSGLITKESSAVVEGKHVEIHQEPSSSELRKPLPTVEEKQVEIHQEPSSSGLTRKKPIPVVEIHQQPSSPSPELIKKPSSAVKGVKHVVEVHQEPPTSELRKKPLPVVEGKRVEIHQEPSSSGLTRKKPSPVFEQDENVVEIHQEPSSSGLISKKSSAVEGEHVEIHQEPSSSGLIKRKQSPVVYKGEHVVEVHPEPYSSEVVRRKSYPVYEEDTEVSLSEEETSSSWEDLTPTQKYIWWPGIADRKKKGDKKKKYGRR